MSHKAFCGSNCERDDLARKMLKIIDGEAVPGAKINDSTLRSYRLVHLSNVIDKLSQLMSPETPMPSK